MSKFTLTDGTWHGVSLNAGEARLLAQFTADHAKCQSGVRIYASRASGIGQNVVVDCPKHARGSQTDITDYASW